MADPQSPAARVVIDAHKAGERRRRFSIAVTLILSFGSLLTVSILTVLLMAMFSARQNTFDLLRDQADLGIGALTSRVDTHMQAARNQAQQLILTVTPFLALIAAYGLAGQDFRLGYYRALFSKPISVPMYYVLLFCCAGVAFWLVQALAMGTFAFAGVNAWDPGLALEASVRFTMLATLTFAMSRVTRLDWIFALLILSLGDPLRGAYPAGESIRGWVINVLFPPTHVLDLAPAAQQAGQITALLPEAGPEWVSVAWLAGYALVCFGIGLLLVRKVPLSSA